jgi:hypothetical protein
MKNFMACLRLSTRCPLVNWLATHQTHSPEDDCSRAVDRIASIEQLCCNRVVEEFYPIRCHTSGDRCTGDDDSLPQKKRGDSHPDDSTERLPPMLAREGRLDVGGDPSVSKAHTQGV